MTNIKSENKASVEGVGDNANEGRSFIEHVDPEFRRNHKKLIEKDLETIKKSGENNVAIYKKV